jgi:N-methylhydantoinase A
VAAGGLRVGPRSAGAEPGPASYGRGGTEPTVTDANLLLGRLPSAARLGGSLALDAAAARSAMRPVAGQHGLDLTGLATGTVAVADAAMANAIREITVARGIDPRDFALLAFGGAGPLHAAALADELELDRIVVPADPGVLSAWGMLQADVRHDLVQAFFTPLEALRPETLDAAVAQLAERPPAPQGGRRERRGDRAGARRRPALCRPGVHRDGAVPPPPDPPGHPLGVPRTPPDPPGHPLGVPRTPPAAGRRHAGRAAGRLRRRAPGPPRAQQSGRGDRVREPAHDRPGAHPPAAAARGAGTAAALPVATQDVRFGDRVHATPVYDRGGLGRGARLTGPCVLLEDACTSVVPPGWSATCSDRGHLLLERNG